jgi:hypothetical protein
LIQRRYCLVLFLVSFGLLGYAAAASGDRPVDFCTKHPNNPNCSPDTPPPSGPCGTLATASYQHVVWVVMENKPYDAVIGSSTAPYENQLANECGLATNYFGVSHPSLPNYIAMTSGSTQGITDDGPPASHPLATESIFSQLGSGWRSLQESMPSNCLQVDAYPYAVKHNPAAYYTGILPACATQDVPLASTPDISARFTLVTPNLCNDTHDCSVATGDSWLQDFMTKVYATPEWQADTTVVFITWDEDDNTASNHVATLVVAPTVPVGTTIGTTFDHYSLLRTTEEVLGLSLLGNAAGATSMRADFHL